MLSCENTCPHGGLVSSPGTHVPHGPHPGQVPWCDAETPNRVSLPRACGACDASVRAAQRLQTAARPDGLRPNHARRKGWTKRHQSCSS